MERSKKRDTAIGESSATTFDSPPFRGGELLGSYKTTLALGRWLTFPPQLAKAIGMEESVFLMNVMFLASEGEEWVERTAPQLEKETSLTYKQQTRVRDHLLSLGLLEVRTNRRDHQTFYRISEEKYDALIAILRRKREFDELTKGSNSTLPKVSSTSLPKVSSLLREEEVQEERKELESLPLRQEERRALPKPVREPKVRRGFQKTPPPKREYVPAPKQPDSWVWFATIFKRRAEVNAVTMPELWGMVDEMLSEIGKDEAEERLSIFLDGAAKVSGWLARDFLAGGWRTIDPEEEHLPRIVNEK